MQQVVASSYLMLSYVLSIYNWLMGKLKTLNFEDDPVMDSVKTAIYNLLSDYYARTDLTELYTFSQHEQAQCLIVGLAWC